MTARDPRAGVTLLETLVALLIMAMVAAILSSGFSASIRNLNRSAGVSTAVDHALARHDLRRWLENASPTSVPSDTRPQLQGTAKELTFLAVPPMPDFWPGAAVEVTLGGEAPTVRLRGIGPDGKTARDATLTLAPPGVRLSFSFWGRRSAEAAPGWHDDWPSGIGLPDLVKLTFTGTSRPLPPMVIRPAKALLQIEMSLSSLVPPVLPSRP